MSSFWCIPGTHLMLRPTWIVNFNSKRGSRGEPSTRRTCWDWVPYEFKSEEEAARYNAQARRERERNVSALIEFVADLIAEDLAKTASRPRSEG